MSEHFIVAFITSIVAAVVATIGIFVIRYCKDWSQRNLTYFVCFAAGVIITVAVLHLIPESLELNNNSALYLLGGYFAMYMINRLLHSFVCSDSMHKGVMIGIITIIGIGFHSFVDGVIYSITFTYSIFTGIIASIGMVMHEFAEGTITYLLLVESKFNERKATLLSFLTAAATTPLGMIISYPFVSNIDNELLGIMLAISGGVLLYVGATHLLPHAEKKATKYSFVAVGAGILIAFVITLSGTHGH